MIKFLKKKISIEFFPKLVEMVKQIEGKLIGLVDMFVEKQKGNVDLIKTNLTKLKEDCREGLDELKNKIVIEDLMIDEEVFLTFDKKFKDLEKEKEKFKNELEKSNEYSKKESKVYSTVLNFTPIGASSISVISSKDLKNPIIKYFLSSKYIYFHIFICLI